MHETDIAAVFLASHPPFDRLDDASLQQAAKAVEIAYYREGQAILDSREKPGLAVIRKGAVRLIDDGHRFLDKRSEGEVFGHGAWFHGAQAPYLAEAEEDSIVWHLPDDRFQALKAGNDAFAAWFDQAPTDRLNLASTPDRPARSVADLLRYAPVTVARQDSIRDTAARMSKQRVSSVLVLDGGRLAGIVTDKDLRRRVVATGQDLSLIHISEPTRQ